MSRYTPPPKEVRHLPPLGTPVPKPEIKVDKRDPDTTFGKRDKDGFSTNHLGQKKYVPLVEFEPTTHEPCTAMSPSQLIAQREAQWAAGGQVRTEVRQRLVGMCRDYVAAAITSRQDNARQTTVHDEHGEVFVPLQSTKRVPVNLASKVVVPHDVFLSSLRDTREDFIHHHLGGPHGRQTTVHIHNDGRVSPEGLAYLMRSLSRHNPSN